MAEAARPEDLPDREALMAELVALNRRHRKILGQMREGQRLAMHDVAVIVEAAEAGRWLRMRLSGGARGSGGGGEAPDIGPEGAD